MTKLTEDVAAGGGLVVWNQVNDTCQSYLPPGPQVSFGLSLSSSVSADNVLHTTTGFNIQQLAQHTANWLVCGAVLIVVP